MAGQKWAWVMVVTSVAFMVWLRGRNRDAAERQELRQYLEKRGLKEAYPDLEAEGQIIDTIFRYTCAWSDLAVDIRRCSTPGIRNVHDLEQLVYKDPKFFKDLKRLQSVVDVVRKEKEAEDHSWTLSGEFRSWSCCGLTVILCY